MDGLKISEVADRTGIPPSALRFYEHAGIITPDRAANGYRTYSSNDVEALRFVTRSKAVGLRLDEIAELLRLRDTDRCAPLQDRLADLVTARLAETRARADELAAFTSELEGLLRQLSVHRPDGPCDEDCGCLTTDVDRTRPEVSDSCSLERRELARRLDDWRSLLSGCAIERDGQGATITLPKGLPLQELAQLVAAETECCSFFTFELRVEAGGRTLRVAAPEAQQEMIDVLIGGASAGRPLGATAVTGPFRRGGL